MFYFSLYYSIECIFTFVCFLFGPYELFPGLIGSENGCQTFHFEKALKVKRKEDLKNDYHP